jgi:vacuolar-type H+-ATPase subunit I/STV1
MSDGKLRDIRAVLDEIKEAEKSLAECQNRESEAWRNTTAAVNNLNNLQKEFDKAMNIMKGQSNRDSGWSKNKNMREV